MAENVDLPFSSQSSTRRDLSAGVPPDHSHPTHLSLFLLVFP